MRAVVEGGRIETGVAFESLELDRRGQVAAVICRDERGRRRRLASHAVVLATGGFGGDAGLRVRHLGPDADQALLRANPHSTGDALRAAHRGGWPCDAVDVDRLRAHRCRPCPRTRRPSAGHP